MNSNRRNIVILFFTLVVVMMGFGMIIPIIPFYIESFGASGSELGILMAVFALMQFFFSPIWGSLSDRYGRKKFLLIGAIGNALSMLFFGLSTQMWMLYISRALAGSLSSATLPTAMAYIGDSTTDEERGGGMGIMGAAMGVGMVIGPGLGGWLAEYSLQLPFYVAAVLSALATVLIILVLPESLPPEKRITTEGQLQGPQFREMWQALYSPVGVLLILAFLVSFGLTNFEAVFGLFSLENFGYGPQQVGVLLMVIGILSAGMQGGLTGPLTKRWGETAVIRTSLIGSAIGFILMLLAFNFLTVLITVGLFIISNALLRPAVSSMISKRASGGQGVAMGLNNAFMSLGRIVGPVWAGFVFDIQIGFPYSSGALIMLVGFVVSLVWLKSTTDGQQS
jgi:MFS transporter, DHA1 family, multidrug resistance protein